MDYLSLVHNHFFPEFRRVFLSYRQNQFIFRISFLRVFFLENCRKNLSSSRLTFCLLINHLICLPSAVKDSAVYPFTQLELHIFIILTSKQSLITQKFGRHRSYDFRKYCLVVAYIITFL